jgi:PAS domain S-box-containing protein
MLNRSGAVTFCNDCFLRLAQLPKEEVCGRNWLDGIIPSAEIDTWKAAIQSSQRDGPESLHFEGHIIPREGPSRIIQWDTISLRSNGSDTPRLAAIGRDITHQRALEAEIRQSQKLDGIGRLAGGIAHDFNNLLTVIVGHASQLLEDTAESDPRHAPIAAVNSAAQGCVELTGQLLAIGRKLRLRPNIVSLNEVITADEVILRSLIGDGIELIIDLASPLPVVFVDPHQIQRVLVNLVTNARDAMPLGGKLTIATSDIVIGEGTTEYPATIKPGRYVRLSVSDTGTGFTDEARTNLFVPFFTTKRPGKGTGLGLSTVYGIVTQSGGYIMVKSEANEGTRFDILLPASSGV